MTTVFKTFFSCIPVYNILKVIRWFCVQHAISTSSPFVTQMTRLWPVVNLESCRTAIRSTSAANRTGLQMRNLNLCKTKGAQTWKGLKLNLAQYVNWHLGLILYTVPSKINQCVQRCWWPLHWAVLAFTYSFLRADCMPRNESE